MKHPELFEALGIAQPKVISYWCFNFYSFNICMNIYVRDGSLFQNYLKFDKGYLEAHTNMIECCKNLRFVHCNIFQLKGALSCR